MAHYAKIDNNNIVIKVIVIDEETVNSGVFGDPLSWIQTSFNTYGGEHSLDGTPLRKNYAGAGYTYDKDRDAFIPPKPYPSWILDEDTCQWDAPVPKPAPREDGKIHIWDEDIVNWVVDKL
jgi:hypothetical protein